MSGSYARGDQPRSGADPDKDAYDAMIRGPVERYVGGTPAWWKAANGILVGDGAIATESAADDREAGR